MKELIKVEVCGDHWLNVDHVRTSLEQQQGQPVALDLATEGPCLRVLGIESLILDYCNKYNLDPELIDIHRWPNAVNITPFTQVEKPLASHFFWISKRYWQKNIIPIGTQHRLAFFLGRKTIARAVMLHTLATQYPNQCLLSLMKTSVAMPWNSYHNGVAVESLDQWINPSTSDFMSWWQNCPISSIDNHSVNDQYNPDQNTNQDLITHYHRFAVELVAESYTMGETFFPTEKTVRPLMAGRPVLVYGAVGYLNRLRAMGFDTWHELWDESYDLLQGPARWQAMHKVIDYIMSMDDVAWQKTMSRATEIAVTNRKNLVEVIDLYQPL